MPEGPASENQGKRIEFSDVVRRIGRASPNPYNAGKAVVSRSAAEPCRCGACIGLSRNSAGEGIMWGADCNHAEGIYDATEMTRRVLAEVLIPHGLLHTTPPLDCHDDALQTRSA